MVQATVKKFFNNIFKESDYQDGYEEELDNEVDYDDGYEVEEPENDTFTNMFKRRNKVVEMPRPQQIKMKISKPTNFDQVEEIISELKSKNSVVINLEYVSKDIARRIMDAVSGAAMALDGHVEKVSNSIFVVAPFNYDIVNEFTKEKIESKFAAPSWIK
ncbi:MAG: cell division protein SepF [Clostridia bacterium]|nr:cell division protein SepF [Clostridia bacterium]